MSKKTGYGLLALLAVLLVVALIWVPKIEVFGWNQTFHLQKISSAFYKRDVFTQEDRARQTLATIVGGLLVLVGAYMTWKNVQVAEKNAEIARDNAETARKVAEQNAETARKTIKIAEDKQITDRFTAAVTNLSADGPEKMAMHLGGIYALERIARDSPNDHWTVMEVLTAYIRDKRSVDLSSSVELNHLEPISTDIQAALTVVGRRNVAQDGPNRLDFQDLNFSRLELEEI